MNYPSFPNVRVVGIAYRPAEAKEFASALMPGDILTIEREPENPHDENAIRVMGGGMHIGYIERQQAVWISGHIDEGAVYEAMVEDIQSSSKTFYPIVTLRPVS